MSRHERDFRPDTEHRLELPLPALWQVCREIADVEERRAAMIRFLAGGAGWREASARLGGSFARKGLVNRTEGEMTGEFTSAFQNSLKGLD